MQSLNRALKPNRITKFFQSQVWFGRQVLSNSLPVGRKNLGFTTGAMMLWSDITEMPPLLDQLLDHALGNAKSTSDLVSSAVPFVISAKNAFTEI